MILGVSSGTKSLSQTPKRTKIRCSETNFNLLNFQIEPKLSQIIEKSQTKFSVAKKREAKIEKFGAEKVVKA